MAVSNNPVLKNIKGHIQKTIVVKQYADKTVITAYPDMSGVVRSKAQKKEQGRFKQAVAYAKSILANPSEKAAFKRNLQPGQNVYHAAIAAFMKKKPLKRGFPI